MSFVKRLIHECEFPKECGECGADLEFNRESATYSCLGCETVFDRVCDGCGTPINGETSTCLVCLESKTSA